MSAEAIDVNEEKTAEETSVKTELETGDDAAVVDDQTEEEGEADEEGEEGGKPKRKPRKPFSYFDKLDAPRTLPEPLELTSAHLKQINEELGLIKLCWPDLTNTFIQSEYPESYYQNSNKEKLLLLYAESFRRQYCAKFPNRKPLFLACENECGMQKMVCTAIRPTTLPYTELETWEKCAQFIADFVKYEPLEAPTLIPKRFNSPHTTLIRQTGHSFEIATVLCSLLIGNAYDAYVVSGYAIKDVTLRILCRTDAPFEPFKEPVEVKPEVVIQEKYKVKSPRVLESKFLAMMKQREIDAAIAEQERIEEEKRLKMLNEEKRPPDDLEGQRIHAWVLLRHGDKNDEKLVFIEPSTGFFYPLNTEIYCGIESMWNHENYWVNLQEFTTDLSSLDYDLTNNENWEHLLVGEPITSRRYRVKELGDEDDGSRDMYDEQHLDMPSSWSSKLHISHSVLKRRFPGGSKVTNYKRTLTEEYAPYVQEDGLLTRITRYEDFDCTIVKTIEETYKNRADKLIRIIYDAKTTLTTQYYGPGREDSVIKYVFTKNDDNAVKTITYNEKGRADGAIKKELMRESITEYFANREDKMYYRYVLYQKRVLHHSFPTEEDERRPILKMIQKFSRNEEVAAFDDIAYREFHLVNEEIKLRFHYAKDRITASTRNFKKPSIAELGEGMTFRPELTNGYDARIGGKPTRQLKLFVMLLKQLKDEEDCTTQIRETEKQIAQFIRQRDLEMVSQKLEVDLFNVEENATFREAMFEAEKEKRICKEREVEEDVDFLTPYLAKIGNPSTLKYEQAVEVRNDCLSDFKDMLVQRANVIQKKFDRTSERIAVMEATYNQQQNTMTPEEETKYFDEINDVVFLLRSIEIRLTRHKHLAGLRYQEMVRYLDNHPMLEVLHR